MNLIILNEYDLYSERKNLFILEEKLVSSIY